MAALIPTFPITLQTNTTNFFFFFTSFFSKFHITYFSKLPKLIYNHGCHHSDVEIPSSLPASKIFKATVLEVDTLVPKIMPQAIKKVEILEGDGGVGNVKLIHFSEGAQYKSIKHRVDAIDTENLTHTYSIIEGDVVSEVIESITHHIKIISTEEGGCICKNRSIYNTKGNVEISEEKIKEGKERAMVMFKAIEAYLQANPDY